MKQTARPYSQSCRQVQTDLTRLLLLQAARDLLVDETEAGRFTLDAVALRAGASRATVFNLFGSKSGLLHALVDELSTRAGLMNVDALLTQTDAHQALRHYVQAFADFYQAERTLLKRLRACAVLDKDFAQLLDVREEKRSAGLTYLVQRLQGTPLNRSPTASQRLLAAKLKALLVLEVFESLAGGNGSLSGVAPTVISMVEAILKNS